MWPSRESIDSFGLSSHFFIIMPSGRSEYKLLTTGRTYQFPIPEKLQGDWVQAFVAMISGIIYVDKRYL